MKVKRRSIAIDDATWKLLEVLAKAESRSISQYIRMILLKHLKSL